MNEGIDNKQLGKSRMNVWGNQEWMNEGIYSLANK